MTLDGPFTLVSLFLSLRNERSGLDFKAPYSCKNLCFITILQKKRKQLWDSCGELMKGFCLVGDCLLSIRPQEKSEGLQLNFQQVRQTSGDTGVFAGLYGDT